MPCYVVRDWLRKARQVGPPHCVAGISFFFQRLTPSVAKEKIQERPQNGVHGRDTLWTRFGRVVHLRPRWTIAFYPRVLSHQCVARGHHWKYVAMLLGTIDLIVLRASRCHLRFPLRFAL
jgi:hypothetical protein